MFELIIIWDDGRKDICGGYADQETAETAGQGMRMAFGNQIAWYGVRKGA